MCDRSLRKSARKAAVTGPAVTDSRVGGWLTAVAASERRCGRANRARSECNRDECVIVERCEVWRADCTGRRGICGVARRELELSVAMGGCLERGAVAGRLGVGVYEHGYFNGLDAA